MKLNHEEVSFQMQLDINDGTLFSSAYCDLGVLWKANPYSSPFQVIYPSNYCYPIDRFITKIDHGSEYKFTIIDKPPCEERNKDFSLEMTNKLDTTVYLYLESASVRFYYPTYSHSFRPQCWPNMCCQYTVEILPDKSYNFGEKVTFFKIRSIGYDKQSLDYNELITLFNPEEGKADSVINVDIRGIVLDSLIVSYSN